MNAYRQQINITEALMGCICLPRNNSGFNYHSRFVAKYKYYEKNFLKGKNDFLLKYPH